METKIRNFFANIENQTLEKAQIFLSSIDSFELKTFIIYLLFKRNQVTLLSLDQLILILDQTEVGSKERIDIWDAIKKRAWSFDKMAFVWRQLASTCKEGKESKEEIEIFEKIKAGLVKLLGRGFYETAWIYKETQEKFWWKKTRGRASSTAELAWVLDSMHSFFNSWHDVGAEWTEEEYNKERASIKKQIKQQIEIGQKKIIEGDKDSMCREIDAEIEAVVFVHDNYKPLTPNAKQAEVQEQAQIDQSVCEPKVDENGFNRAVKLWDETSSGSIEEEMAFDVIKTLADTFDREVFVYMNESPDSVGEREALDRLKKREKTLRQKLYLLDRLEGKDKEALWFDIESSMESIDDAILVWTKVEKVIEKRKRIWLLLKKELKTFSKSFSLFNDPPIKLSAIERKDLWSLLVENAVELEELVWVWINAHGELKEATYTSIVEIIEV